MSSRLYLAVICGLLYGMTLQAAPLVSPLDHVEWRYSGDQFVCKLTTKVDTFGSVSLIKNAGYPEYIDVSSVVYTDKVKHYQLGGALAPWGIKSLPKSKWFYPPQTLVKQISSQVPRFLQLLQKGMWGHINLEYAGGEQVHLVLPSVNRGQSFEEFYQCLSEIAPYSYSQVRDRNFYFDAGVYLLNEPQQQEMARIARYIMMDPQVGKVLIDGHADRAGNLVSNLRLSQLRADDLYTHLIEVGVPAALMEVRSHGERYPLNLNSTVSGSSKSRRVNLRIIRGKGN